MQQEALWKAALMEKGQTGEPNGKVLMIALDLSKTRHEAVVGTTDGKILQRGRVPHSREGFESFVRDLRARWEPEGFRSLICFMEGTGHYWMVAAYAFQSLGVGYALINPLKVRRQTEINDLTRHKDDTIDSEAIYDLAWRGQSSKTRLVTEQPWCALRAAGTDNYIVQDLIVAERNRIHAFLELVYPEYYEAFGDPFGNSSLALLQVLPMVHGSAPADAVTLEKAVRARLRGKILMRARVARVVDLVRRGSSFGVKPLAADVSQRIAQAAERLALFERQKEETTRRLLSAYESVPYRAVLDTLGPSMSRFHALCLAFAGDLKQYESSAALVKLAGLQPTSWSSGASSSQGHLPHRGRSLLSRTAVNATGFMVARSRPPIFRERFWELQTRPTRPLKPMAALAAVASKYLRTLHRLATTGQPFDETRARIGEKEDT
jgi:transposase